MAKIAYLALIISLVFTLTLAVNPVFAQPDLSNANLETPGTSRTLVLPPAAANAPVISLGSGIDPQTGKKVEGIAFIHYKKDYTHKPKHPGGAGPSGNSCFSYLSRGAKWKTVEPWVTNTANSEGLTDDFVFNNQVANIDKWEDAANGIIGDAISVDILGNGATTSAVLIADQSSPDGVNETYFGDVSTTGAIAVTIVWGIFSGPPSARELVEWDMVFDDVDFDWSATGEAGKMDFENIDTHEKGHAKGMGHPDDSCTEETMYRFAANGETKKRDLHTGDINGINNLY